MRAGLKLIHPDLDPTGAAEANDLACRLFIAISGISMLCGDVDAAAADGAIGGAPAPGGR